MTDAASLPADHSEAQGPRDGSTKPSEAIGISRTEALLITALAAIGFIASFLLMNDKIKSLRATAEGDQFSASCDVSAFVSCSGVFNTAQSEVFGFPNPLIGIAGFTVVITLGVVLAGSVALPRFVWFGLGAGAIFGIGFVTWLQYQSLYEIVKLCPYCMVVWAVMIPLFVLIARRVSAIVAPDGAITRLLSNWTLLIVLLWYLAIAAAIWFKFGSTLWA